MHKHLPSLLLGGFFILFAQLHAQIFSGPLPSVGARAVALGNTYTAVNGDVWTAFQNPAGIAGTQAFEIGSFVEQRFLLSELAFGSAGAVFPFAENQGIGVSVSSRGFSDFRENMAGLSYGIKLLNKISLGTRVNFANVSIPSYGTTSAFFVDFGLQYQFNSQLTLGASMLNLNQARFSNSFGETTSLPTVISLGLAYQPIEQVLIVADVVKDVNFPASFRGGIEYAFTDILYARIGVGTEPIFVAGGLGVKWKGLKVDFALSYTEFVQYTPHFSVSYTFGQEENK